MILLHPHKVLIKTIMKKMLNQMIKAKKRAMIKGEMIMLIFVHLGPISCLVCVCVQDSKQYPKIVI
jgi:hypothetical protein